MSRTPQTKCWWLTVVLAGGCLTGCGNTSDNDRAGASVEANASTFAAIRKAEQLTLYEGLPHQGNERELYTQEKRDKPTVEFHGYPFYRTPLEVSAGDAKQLKSVLGAEGSFRGWQGEKKCGGFHPDYLAEWRVGEATYQVLICFGCGEVKLFGPDRTARYDFEHEAQTHLAELLRRHRRDRPANRESP